MIKRNYIEPQKPVELCEWLIRSYSNEGDLVLDFCMGSGSTIVSCLNTNRRYIGIEKNKTIFNIAKTRIEKIIDQREREILVEFKLKFECMQIGSIEYV